jgi:hypothetical protein
VGIPIGSVSLMSDGRLSYRYHQGQHRGHHDPDADVHRDHDHHDHLRVLRMHREASLVFLGAEFESAVSSVTMCRRERESSSNRADNNGRAEASDERRALTAGVP